MGLNKYFILFKSMLFMGMRSGDSLRWCTAILMFYSNIVSDKNSKIEFKFVFCLDTYLE